MKLNLLNKVLGGSIICATLLVFFRRIWLMELDAFDFDDAYMFIRYAENILAGYGYAWNPGESMIYGNTSILYTYVIALNKFLFGSFLSNSWVLISTTSIFAIGALIILQNGLFRETKGEILKNRFVIALFTLPFIVLPLILGFHIGTGMETTLSLFLNMAFVFAILKFNHSDAPLIKQAILSAILAYLAFLCRPDNALVVALFPALLFAAKKKFKHILYFGGVLAVLIAIDSIVKYMAFGEILPLSFYAKKSGFTVGYTAKYFWNPIKYITQMAAYMMPFLLVIFLFARKKYIGLLTAFFLPLVLTGLYYFTFDQVMGFNARLYLPFIPYVIIPAILILDRELITLKKGDSSIWNFDNLITKTALLILFLFFMVFSKYRFINMYETYAIKAGNKDAILLEGHENRKYNREASIKLISNLLKEYPDDFVFAATEHGFISGDNPNKVILDLSGLHNKEIAKNGYNEKILIEAHPDFVWMPHQDLTVLHYEIRTSPYFIENYEYIKDIYAFGCAIRKDSKYYESLKQKIR